MLLHQLHSLKLWSKYVGLAASHDLLSHLTELQSPSKVPQTITIPPKFSIHPGPPPIPPHQLHLIKFSSISAYTFTSSIAIFNDLHTDPTYLNENQQTVQTTLPHTMARMKRAAAGDASAPKKHKGQSVADFFRTTLDALELLQDDEADRLLVTAFVKLPPKKLYPDYYALISDPISLAEIHKKVARGNYDDVQQFVLDFRKMYKNAMNYNDPDSWIVRDASKLLDFIDQQVNHFGSGLDAITVADLPKLCGEILEEVIHYDFPGEGQLSAPFMDDVDIDEYPDYGKMIDFPTSFNSVLNQVNTHLFSENVPLEENLQAFYDATSLIFINAQTFNDPSALIYEDSKKLQEIFDEKYLSLKHEALPGLALSIKLNLTAPKEPLKLKLHLKKEEPPKKKRGRKPKKVVEEEQRRMVKTEILEPEDDEEEDEEASRKLNATESNVMGKTKKIPPSDEVFIRNVSFSSSRNNSLQLMTTIASQPQFTPTKAQTWTQAFFPGTSLFNAATFFEYKFGPFGYSTKSYSLSLPQDSTPFISLKVSLHELIHAIKKPELVAGQGLLKGNNEDFLVALFHNAEEVSSGCEMSEEADPVSRTKLLNLQYELKLNYGLNVLTFELRLSPNLARELKAEVEEPESGDVAGRHTRHQLQQIKLNWEVEKFTLCIVSPCP